MEQTILNYKSNYPRMAQFITEAIMLDQWNVDLLTVEEAKAYIKKAYIYDDYNESQTMEQLIQEGHGEVIIGHWELIFKAGDTIIINQYTEMSLSLPNKVAVKVESIFIDAHNLLISEQISFEIQAKVMEKTYNELNKWSR